MSFPFFPALPDDLRRALEGERRAEEAKRRLEARLREEQASTKKWMNFNKDLREKARALLADADATREKCWDLMDENKRLRGENQLLDAENNQLRDDNAKLQQDLGTAARCSACKKRKTARAKKLVPLKRGPRRDGRPTRLCAARADYRQYR